MECISISHKTAESADRQRCFIVKEEREDCLREMLAVCGMEQCVLVSTCNRTEVYVPGEANRFRALEEALAGATGCDGEWIRGLARRYQGRKALQHLFRVVCGMESMVIGEDEILGQVRDAYIHAKEAGCTGYELNCIFQAALACAKRVKTETMLSKTSVSVATLAANEVFRLPGTEKNVLIIGASGKMGMTVMKNLACRETVRIFGTFRSHNALLTQAAGKADATLIPYEERYACMDKMDAVISATSSPHYTVTKKQLEPALRREKERLFLDISVPPDIDREIQTLPGVHLRNIDAFRELAKTNNDLKQQEAVQAERMIEQGLDEWKRDVLLHGFLPELPAVKAKMAEIPFEKLVYRAKADMDAGQFEALLAVLRGMEEER